MESEIRCPYGFQRLFAKVRIEGDSLTITSDNLFEFACSDCARELRKIGHNVFRVLHRYNIAGEYVDSETIKGK